MANRAHFFIESKDKQFTEKEHTFQEFLSRFIPEVAKKAKQANLAAWILETTGSSDAAELKAEIETELKLLLQNPKTYEEILKAEVNNPLLKREKDLLIRTLLPHQVKTDLLVEITQKEAELSLSYANFRPTIEGKRVSENGIREILKKEKDQKRRQKAWEASKEIGTTLAPQIVALVKLRNRSAEALGFPDYFQMQLQLQEVDPKWLFSTFEDLASRSEASYAKALEKIEAELSSRFAVSTKELGPWAWADPFSQEDPLRSNEFDALFEGVDIEKAGVLFYERMGIDITPILKRSDNFEREGKNQHAFCIHIDRLGDIRTLNNIKPSLKWMETWLHELGHAIYEMGFKKDLPWLLLEPPHMITTEAMALLSGREAYKKASLSKLLNIQEHPLLEKIDESLKRQQLIFSRFVFVMTAFESELYKNPDQDLNLLWWDLVEKYQKIKRPLGREGKCDWATKYHIGLAPAYYFSYLIGELFASQIHKKLLSFTPSLDTPKAGAFLQEKLFFPGNSLSWNDLIVHTVDAPLSSDAWIEEFAPF